MAFSWYADIQALLRLEMAGQAIDLFQHYFLMPVVVHPEESRNHFGLY